MSANPAPPVEPIKAGAKEGTSQLLDSNVEAQNAITPDSPQRLSAWRALAAAAAPPPCEPPFWAKGGNRQTLFGLGLPSAGPTEPLQETEIPLDDGDRLIAFHHAGSSDTLIYLFHGLGGSTESNYMRRSIRLCQLRGYSVLAVNHRGCGAGQGHAVGPYHAGRGEDLSAAIAFGRKHFGAKRHIAMGFSLGANALLVLLTGKRGSVLPDMAIAVNAPIHLLNGVSRIHAGRNRLYEMRFVYKCRRAVRQRRAAGLIDVDYHVPPFCTLKQFDDGYTAPAGGFRDSLDYYKSCSTHQLLDRVQVPTVLMMSKDDPLLDYRDYLKAPLSPAIHFHLEESGGHMGYMTRSKTPLGTRRWLDYALDRYLAAMVTFAI